KSLLNNISLVCKQWHKIVMDHPPLWNTIEITCYNSYKKFLTTVDTHPWNSIKRLLYRGEEEMVKILEIMDYIPKLTSLIQFDWRIGELKSLDKFALLTNLTSLNLSDCWYIENIDALGKLTNL